MAAKRKRLLAQRVRELEDAVSRLFSGEAPSPEPVKRRKAAKSSRTSKLRRAAGRAAANVKKNVRRAARKAKRKGNAR